MCEMEYDFETLVDRRGTGSMKFTLEDEALGAVVLSGAEMDYATAPVIRRALADFARRGIYGYTLQDDAYREAVCSWMRRARGFEAKKEEIVVTLGTIFALDTAVRAFTEPGDGVIVQHPSYYRYDVGIARNSRRVVDSRLLEANCAYSIDFEDLERKMAEPKNKLFVLCNPHNPTGKVFSASDISLIARLANKYGVIVFSDEIFAEISYAGHEVAAYVSADPEFGITSTSLGKLFNLTGVNHANLIIKNPALREKYMAQRAIDHFGSVDPFFYQAVMAGYSEEGLDWSRAMAGHTWGNYVRIRDFLAEKLPYIALSPLEGGFVAWMDMRALRLDDNALQAFLLNEARIVTDPGVEYGAAGAGFIRLNIATPRERIEAFLNNLEAACALKERAWGIRA